MLQKITIGQNSSWADREGKEISSKLYLCRGISLAVLGSILSFSAAMADETNFNIKSQSLRDALLEFSAQADVVVVVPEGVGASEIKRALSGIMEADEGLKLLLEDTGLYYTRGKSGQFNISKDPSYDFQEISFTTEADYQENFSVHEDDERADDIEDIGFEEIVVTASKRAVNIQSLAQSVQAVSGDALEAIGAVDIADFVDKIPGLTLSDGGGGMSSLQIRGISSLANTTNASATVGYYINDTPISDSIQAPSAAMFDLERVEVLKGPQGTLYGEGSLGGTIRFITRKPQLDVFEGKAQFLASTINKGSQIFQVSGVLNLPIVEEKVAMRIVGAYIDNGGFVDDVNSGQKDVNGSNKTNLRFALRFEPSENLTISPSFTYQKTNRNSRGYSSPLYDDLEFFEGIPVAFSHDEYELYSLNVEYDLEWADLVSNTSYFDRRLNNADDFQRVNDLLNSVLIGFGLNSPYTQQDFMTTKKIFSQEARLVSSGDGPLSWVFGGYYRHRSTTEDAVLNNDQWQLLFGDNRVFGLVSEQKAKQVAVFGEINYDLTDKITLTGGLRWFNEKIDGVSEFGTFVTSAFAYLEDTVDTNINEDGVLFKLALGYQVTEDMLLYALFTQGIRPGGTNTRAVNFSDAPLPSDIKINFKSDSVNNYEVGLKSDWYDNRLRFNLALFYLDWTDIQVVDTGVTGQSFIRNAAKAESIGFEVELLAEPVEGLIIGLNLGYNKAQTTSNTPLFGGRSISDNAVIPYTPEWSGSGFVEYSIALDDDLDGFANVDAQYMGERVGTVQVLPGAPVEVLDDYTTVNLRVGVRAEEWNISLFAKNLTDTRAKLQRNINPPEGYLVSQPRSIGLQFATNF